MNKAQIEQALQQALRRKGGSRMARLMRQPYRSIAPVLARRIGWSREVACPTFFGGEFHGLLPEAVTTQVWRSTAYSPDVCRAVMHVLEPGKSFMDIGAHFGFFSLFAAHLVGSEGRTLSVEAMPETYGYLSRNMSTFVAEGRAQIHNCAAFDQETTLTFKDFGIVASSLNTAFENRGSSSLIKEPRDVTVVARTGDALLAEAGMTPDLIKIDAESAEIFVLRGLQQTLQRVRPALILELGDDPSSEDSQTEKIWTLLKELDYRPVHFPGPDPVPFSMEGAVAYANVLFLPPEDH